MSMDTVWARFFGTAERRSDGTPYRALVDEAAASGAQHPSVVIDWFDLSRFNGPVADTLLVEPDGSLREAEAALRERAPDVKLRARVRDLPDDRHIPLPALRETHIGQMVSVRGVVNSTSDVVAYPYEALFRCLLCHGLFHEPQPDPMQLRDPIECKQSDHGKKRPVFEFVLSDAKTGLATRRVDMQGFQLQEPPDSITGTRTPEAKPCRVFGDLCGSALPGERVRVTGILRATPRRRGRERSAVLEYHIEVSAIAKEQSTYETIHISDDEEKDIKAFSQRPGLVKDLVASLAPSIHGLDPIKLGILLQLGGGVSKDLEEGRRVRGDIHVLLIGDPGQGKSALLRRAAAISPRGIYGEAPTISAPGLVGSVERVNQGLGETWVYHCGLVTMAHAGLLVIDEADKPRDEALHGSLLTPMALGIATLNKAGARDLQLRAEVAVLMGANFKEGRYDQHEPISAQIGLPPPLLDRLDLLFTLRDHVDPQGDQKKVAAMLRGHLYGGIRAARGAGHDVRVPDEDADAAADAMKAPLDTDQLRKYLAYARRTVTPILDAATMARIMEKYALARRRRSNADMAPVGESPRYVDSLVRLAEAAARLRLSPLVEEEDIELAYGVWKEGVEQHLRTASGELDADRIGSVESADQRQRIKSFRHMIEELGELNPGNAPDEEQIVREAIRRGFARDFALGTLQRFKDNGTLVQRGGGWVTVNALAKKKGAPKA